MTDDAPTIHVCPLCGRIADESDDYGYSLSCYHEEYRSIEPVEVVGTREGNTLTFPLPDPEEWKRSVGAEILANREEQERKRAEWLALSCDERVAIQEAERREMSPFGRLMSEEMMGAYLDMVTAYSSMCPPKEIVERCPRCRDVGCENTTRRPNPNYREPGEFWGSVSVEAGSTLEDA